MKKFTLTLVFAMTLTQVIAQPAAFKYQSVVRDADGVIMINQTVSFRISILEDDPYGTAIYSEDHNISTNDFGLASLEIGNGNPVLGTFDAIDWGSNDHYLEISIDLNGDNAFILMGTSQLLSVPYAIHANSFSGDMAGLPIVNVGNPVLEQDAATKAYVDLLLERLEILEEAFYQVTDVDGNVYRTLKIGNQFWMAENLRVTQYNNEDDIPTGLNDTDWGLTPDGAYAVYDDDPGMAEAYGLLYNWFALNDPRGLCPEGWQIPSNEDWIELENFLITKYSWTNNPGDPDAIGNRLKSCRQVDSQLGGDCDTQEHPRWNLHTTHQGTDDIGFGAYPGGYRHPNGYYSYRGAHGYWWSSTEDYNPDRALSRRIKHDDGNMTTHNTYHKRNGFSVRCMKN